MAWVMLRRDWPANFRRTIRDDNGLELGVMHFVPGEPVEVEGDQLKGIRKDIGAALVWCQLTPEGRGIGKPHADQSKQPTPPPAPVEVESDDTRRGGRRGR